MEANLATMTTPVDLKHLYAVQEIDSCIEILSATDENFNAIKVDVINIKDIVAGQNRLLRRGRKAARNGFRNWLHECEVKSKLKQNHDLEMPAIEVKAGAPARSFEQHRKDFLFQLQDALKPDYKDTAKSLFLKMDKPCFTFWDYWRIARSGYVVGLQYQVDLDEAEAELAIAQSAKEGALEPLRTLLPSYVNNPDFEPFKGLRDWWLKWGKHDQWHSRCLSDLRLQVKLAVNPQLMKMIHLLMALHQRAFTSLADTSTNTHGL